jgi:type IV secretion system protein VirB10
MVSPDRLQSPASPYLIQAGSIIPAALITGLRSDLPGLVTAQVSENVYDSMTGTYLLIPQGSRLIGQYDNAIAFGQSRVLLAWTRLILPNGRSLILEKLSAADPGGMAGLADRTDYHWSGMLQAAALSTLLSIGAEAESSDRDSDIVRALRSGASDSIGRTGQQIVERQLNIQPTLTIRPGFPVRVILSRDLVLELYGE